MKSIRTKLGLVILIPTLVILLAFGAIFTTFLRASITNDANDAISANATRTANAISTALGTVETKVADIVTSINTLCDEAKIKSGDKTYFTVFEATINKLAINATKDIDGLVTSYVRYVPSLTHGTSGMFYTSDGAGNFSSVEPTDLDQYDPSDTEHVGWFYTPLENGVATWMEPYYNANIDSMIISYCIPFYLSDRTSFGVVGVDFDFRYLSDLIAANNTYETGSAFIMNDATKLLYHPQYENGELLTEIDGGRYLPFTAMASEYSSGYYNNAGMIAGFATISNGWRVCLMPEYSEVYSLLNALINLLIIFLAGATVVMIVIAFIYGRRISKPIMHLEATAAHLADGELDAEIVTHGKDEIARLGLAMRRLVDQLVSYRGYIDEITATLGDFAEGKLTVELKQDYTGEFSRIKESLNALSASYTELVGKIQTSAHEIAQGTELLADGSQALASGATDQANSVEKLSASLMQMKDRIDASAENSARATELAKTTDGTVDSALNELTQMLASMDEISSASNQIRNVIKVIDDIAFQTNILALNAAVEAARAGEAGKGFAVVADEVRNLASKSSEAAKQTTALIENSISAVERGSALAKGTGDAFGSVSESTNGVVRLMEQISLDSQAQAAGIAEVSTGIAEISTVVQTNSATTQESAAACQQLTGQAALLRTLTQRFTV